jgi:Outer membrane lipoprotein-sorting protein
VFGKISTINGIFFLIAAMAAAQVPGLQPNVAGPESQQRPDLSTIVQRMEQAARENREHYRAYIVTRNYRLFGGSEQNPSSEVMADISFVPPATKDFTITQKKGSSRGEAVVRRILESERKDTASGQAPGAVTHENYDFTFIGEQRLDGNDCYLLGLKPKRKEKNVLIGRAWVDKNSYLVRRVQGDMVKMPSWWVKAAQVTLEFGDVNGMWLQMRTKATADVRIFGPHTLTGQALKVRTGESVAELTAPQPKAARRPFRPGTVLGTIEH